MILCTQSRHNPINRRQQSRFAGHVAANLRQNNCNTGHSENCRLARSICTRQQRDVGRVASEYDIVWNEIVDLIEEARMPQFLEFHNRSLLVDELRAAGGLTHTSTSFGQ